MRTKKRALISVYDKSGIVEFARGLVSIGFEIISTGGTYAALAASGIDVVQIDKVTGFPEMLDGRVKTLHPMIHGGLLARRDLEDHMRQLREHGIETIDLVVVNLYPFEKTVASGAGFSECIEQIDIGGPSMLRSAAKNHASVTVVCDPSDYEAVIEEFRANGDTSLETRQRLAAKVFNTTSRYDAAIGGYLKAGGNADSDKLPDMLSVNASRVMALRYGENPHQQAALYGGFFECVEQLHGKELSFNNIVDIQASIGLLEEFEQPACVIIKHTNPCGCAIGGSIEEAYQSALATDRKAAYGGILAFNREISADFAAVLNEMFSEVIIAPSFHQDALPILQKKRDRRLLEQKRKMRGLLRYDMKTVVNGYLYQTVDDPQEDPSQWRVVTKRAPSEQEMRALTFAWHVVKHVRSNAIVYTAEDRTLGVGAGQMSRVDSSTVAVMKARQAGLSLEGSVVASDAYFPFADGLLEAASAGVTAVIEPGGSVRDAEVIEAADKQGLAMVFTGMRHFKH
jgi:phosphoribosylaminoimidazolecarboxamide formyltransferase/IMP cyclohydrolase